MNPMKKTYLAGRHDLVYCVSDSNSAVIYNKQNVIACRACVVKI